MKPQNFCPNCKKTTEDILTLKDGSKVYGFINNPNYCLCFFCSLQVQWEDIHPVIPVEIEDKKEGK